VTNVGSELDWARLTVPQDQLNDRTLLLPAGRVVGGSSSINVAMWLRGDERDYKAWAEIGGPAWRFGPARRAFKKIEDYRGEGGPARSRDGPILVGVPVATHPLSPLLLRAAEEIGVRRIQMNERPQIDGADFVDENVDARGRRVGAAQGYLLPVLARPNLTLLTRTEVTGLLFSGSRCRGVSAVHEGRRREFGAMRDVVLCAGALGTPKLLLLSGIGPADELRRVGVYARQNLSTVGSNLHDHVLLPGFYFPTSRKLPPPVTNGVSTVTYLRTNPPAEAPNVQLVSLHFALLSNTFAPQEAYAVWPVLMKPASRGRVRLGSADPNASLLIDPNYLEAATDRAALRQGLAWALELGNARALSRWRRGTLSLRDFAPEGANAFIRQNAGTDFHSVGTCAFGLDPERSVVDARNLQVWGVDGLRIVDASVIPEIPSVNTHAPVLIVAELAAERIAGARQTAATAG
jgi:choline dehydrogenase